MRTVAVTGAASGIGKATAALAGARGWRVITLDLHEADVVADLSTPAGRAEAVAGIGRLAGDSALDAVIACAGVASMGHLPGSADLIARVNFFGAVQVVEGTLPLLRRSAAGRAVVFSSTAALHLPPDGSERLLAPFLAGDEDAAAGIAEGNASLAYSVSKNALARWVRREAVRPEWAGAGVLLNAIAPGAVATPMIAELLASEEGREKLAAATPMPLGRPADPVDVAELALFLAGAENRNLVGQTVFCDGGAEAALRPEKL